MAYLSRTERRTSMVRAGADLIAEQGLGAVTARQVAERIGGSQGQIHHHFDSTDQLAAEAWGLFATEAMAGFVEAARPLSTPAVLRLFFDDLLQDPGADGRALARWAEAGAYAQLRPEVGEAYRASLERLVELMAQVLVGTVGSGEGAVTGAGDRAPARARHLLMVGVGLAGTSRIAGTRPVDSAAAMTDAIDSVLRPL